MMLLENKDNMTAFCRHWDMGKMNITLCQCCDTGKLKSFAVARILEEGEEG